MNATFFKVAMLSVAACAFFAGGCNKEEIRKLQEQAAVVTKENYDLKDKLAAVDKERKALSEQVNTLSADREQCGRELQVAKLAAADKKAKQKKPEPAPRKAGKKKRR
jgi:predicted  nucleic acid-binding Zn-ribbon protein